MDEEQRGTMQRKLCRRILDKCGWTKGRKPDPSKIPLNPEYHGGRRFLSHYGDIKVYYIAVRDRLAKM